MEFKVQDIQVNGPASVRVRPEDATNIQLKAERMEIKDNFGRLEILKPVPGLWKDFYDRMLAEKGRQNKRKVAEFTEPFNGERYRCILADTSSGQTISMRKLPKSALHIERDLGFSRATIESLLQGSGLTIIGGQIGSGKTTTLISALEMLGPSKRGNLGTVEQPIEFIFPEDGVIQREVGTHVDSFAEAVEHFLRMDRDTIMIGEIRDFSTAEAAVMAAACGHSVVATIHADSAIDIPTRMATLLDAKLIRLLPTVLRGLWWQHIYRRGDGSGVAIPIYESLQVTNSVRQIISSGPEALPQLMQEMHAQGRENMAQVAQKWMRIGKVNADEMSQWLQPRGRVNDVYVPPRRP